MAQLALVNCVYTLKLHNLFFLQRYKTYRYDAIPKKRDF